MTVTARQLIGELAYMPDLDAPIELVLDGGVVRIQSIRTASKQGTTLPRLCLEAAPLPEDGHA